MHAAWSRGMLLLEIRGTQPYRANAGRLAAEIGAWPDVLCPNQL
jgi:hypothetical protein